MKIAQLLHGFATLCCFQFLGELIALLLPIRLPGAVIGMVLLFVWLLRRPATGGLQSAAHGLLRWLGLLFVPAAVGVTAYLPLLREIWPQMLLLLLLSALFTIGVSGVMMQSLLRIRRSVDEEGERRAA